MYKSKVCVHCTTPTDWDWLWVSAARRYLIYINIISETRKRPLCIVFILGLVGMDIWLDWYVWAWAMISNKKFVGVGGEQVKWRMNIILPTIKSTKNWMILFLFLFMLILTSRIYERMLDEIIKIEYGDFKNIANYDTVIIK